MLKTMRCSAVAASGTVVANPLFQHVMSLLPVDVHSPSASTL